MVKNPRKRITSARSFQKKSNAEEKNVLASTLSHRFLSSHTSSFIRQKAVRADRYSFSRPKLADILNYRLGNSSRQEQRVKENLIANTNIASRKSSTGLVPIISNDKGNSPTKPFFVYNKKCSNTPRKVAKANH